MSMNFVKMMVCRGPLRASSKSHFENALKESHFRNHEKQAFPVSIIPILLFKASIVENIGVEPMTSCVQGRRSSQLS